jgi:predicted HAD superfamily Cof-like phosphohydrolase
MKNLLEKVAEFQIASDQTVETKPNPYLGRKEFLLRYELMREENKEMVVAWDEQNIVEIADALGDQLYVLLGTINAFGLQNKIEQVFNLIHENNMGKVVDGKVIRGKDGKILKPEGFKKVELSTLFQF